MLKNDIKNEIIEELRDYEGVYGCDLAYEMYNTDYYIIGTYKAKQFIKENFDEMCEALEDYQSMTGETYPDITNPEKLASLTALYVAQSVLNELDTLQDNWDNMLDEEMIEEISEELKGQVR